MTTKEQIQTSIMARYAWKSLEERSALIQQLEEVLPIDRGEEWEGAGNWEVRRYNVQKNLTKYSPEGELLIPEDYIRFFVAKEVREWNEWEATRKNLHEDDMDDGKSQIIN